MARRKAPPPPPDKLPYPATSDRVYTPEEAEFLAAVRRFRERRRAFPAVCEYLEILKSLGYEKRKA